MASVLPFIRKSAVVLDDHATLILGQAFDAACKDLHDRGQPTIVYEIIANRMIAAAKAGELDPMRLRTIGLAALGLDNTR